jgi:hypothetical protein
MWLALLLWRVLHSACLLRHVLLQVLEQFLKPGEEMEYAAPDLLEKTRYALWRAAEIRKALREGRQPAPPPDAGSSMPEGAAGGGDMFAGPAYEQSMPGEQQQAGMPPGQCSSSSLKLASGLAFGVAMLDAITVDILLAVGM